MVSLADFLDPLESQKNWMKVVGRGFLTICLPTCTDAKPCVSCTARGLLDLNGLTSTFISLSQQYQTALPEPLDMKIADVLTLSTQILNRLQKNNIVTLRDLVDKKEAELLAAKGFGEKSVRAIKTELHSFGLWLGMFD